MRDLPKVCGYLHLPVQSGSDAVLRRMRRQYTVERFEELVAEARETVPGITLATDVIVGFCGETCTHARIVGSSAAMRSIVC